MKKLITSAVLLGSIVAILDYLDYFGTPVAILDFFDWMM